MRFILFTPFFCLTAPSYSSSVFSYRWFLALVIFTCFQVNTVTVVVKKKTLYKTNEDKDDKTSKAS